MKVRIVSDGTAHGMKVGDSFTGGTRVYNDDTGEEIHVRSVSWKCGVDDRIATAMLELELVEVDVVAEAAAWSVGDYLVCYDAPEYPTSPARVIVTHERDDRGWYGVDVLQEDGSWYRSTSPLVGMAKP